MLDYTSIFASVAEWSIATDCKSVALRATKVRILPGAPPQTKNLPYGRFFYAVTFVRLLSLDIFFARGCFSTVMVISPPLISTSTLPPESTL